MTTTTTRRAPTTTRTHTVRPARTTESRVDTILALIDAALTANDEVYRT